MGAHGWISSQNRFSEWLWTSTVNDLGVRILFAAHLILEAERARQDGENAGVDTSFFEALLSELRKTYADAVLHQTIDKDRPEDVMIVRREGASGKWQPWVKPSDQTIKIHLGTYGQIASEPSLTSLVRRAGGLKNLLRDPDHIPDTGIEDQVSPLPDNARDERVFPDAGENDTVGLVNEQWKTHVDARLLELAAQSQRLFNLGMTARIALAIMIGVLYLYFNEKLERVNEQIAEVQVEIATLNGQIDLVNAKLDRLLDQKSEHPSK